jgi:acetoacetyl-CoA synthetase
MSETNIAVLSTIWSRLLQIPSVHPDDNFFDLGGDSLLAVNMFLEVERATGRHFPITTIYDAPTIAELAEALDTEDAPAFSHLVKLKDGSDNAPFFILHGVGGTVMELDALGKLIRSDKAVYAIQARGLDGIDPPLESIEEMAALYIGVIREKQNHGPYFLGGYSFGGLIAMEMARLLGPENVAQLLMIDTFAHPQTWPRKSRALVKMRKIASRARSVTRQPIGETAKMLTQKISAKLARHDSANAKADRAAYVNSWLGAINPDLPLPLRQTRIAGDAALIAYTPRYYPGAVTFLRARKTGTVFPPSASHVWRKLIGQLEIQSTQGDHKSIIAENAPELADRVSRLLTEQKTQTVSAQQAPRLKLQMESS